MNYLKNRGIDYLKSKNSTTHSRYFINIDRLFLHIENTNQDSYYEIATFDHVMLLTVKANPNNQHKSLTFFDSNRGLYRFNDLAEAKNFIIEFSKYTSEEYQWNLEKIDNPEIRVAFFVKASTFSDQLIDLTPPKDQISLMVINNIITQKNIIPTNDGAEIKFLQLNQHNNTVTFTIEKNQILLMKIKKLL